ncbi:hypothetical protein BDZ45DRAFT_375658 [Acephala macrosclerotiorum]|nr:hypothetical protein BDZ45DRAFT_375658 [Acephala macrosclerotiorum]
MSYDPLQDKPEHDSQNGEDYDHLLPQEESLLRRPPRIIPRWIFIVGSPIISLLLIGFGAWLGSHSTYNFNAKCLEHAQKWSPIQRDVNNNYHEVLFNGSFMKQNAFRLEASPEVDAAWDSLGINYRSIRISTEDAARTGLSPTQVQINPIHGGGYPANVEGLHHLHCLNLVRQSLYYNIDYYRTQGTGAFVNDEPIVRHHVSHCLDIVRQQLMCQPDTGMLGQVWWDKEEPKAFVDFNTRHQCKDFEGIRAWAEERQIEEVVPGDFLMPPRSRDNVLDEIP